MFVLVLRSYQYGIIPFTDAIKVLSRVRARLLCGIEFRPDQCAITGDKVRDNKTYYFLVRKIWCAKSSTQTKQGFLVRKSCGVRQTNENGQGMITLAITGWNQP